MRVEEFLRREARVLSYARHVKKHDVYVRVHWRRSDSRVVLLAHVVFAAGRAACVCGSALDSDDAGTLGHALEQHLAFALGHDVAQVAADARAGRENSVSVPPCLDSFPALLRGPAAAHAQFAIAELVHRPGTKSRRLVRTALSPHRGCEQPGDTIRIPLRADPKTLGSAVLGFLKGQPA